MSQFLTTASSRLTLIRTIRMPTLRLDTAIRYGYPVAFVAVRKFSLHRRKIDGEEKKRRRRHLEIIGWRPCLMKFDINLTV